MMGSRRQLAPLIAFLLRGLEEPTEQRLPLDPGAFQRSEQIAVRGRLPVLTLVPGERVLRMITGDGAEALDEDLLRTPGARDARRSRHPSTEQKRVGTRVALQGEGERDMLLEHDSSVL